jgi:hypothetical protein
MRMGWFLVIASLVLSAMPMGVATSAGVDRVVILHDVPDDGRTFVGNAVQFGWMMLTASHEATVHKDGHIRVVHNNRTIYETHGTSAAHDYDALNTFTIRFDEPGPYRVEASVPRPTGVLRDAFEGFVHPRNESQVTASPVLSARLGPIEPTGGRWLGASWALNGPHEEILDHTDGLVDVRDALGVLRLRTHLHTHESPMSFNLRLDASDSATVAAQGYNAFPTESGAQFASVAAQQRADGCLSCASMGPSGAVLGPANPDASKYKVLTTYDPYATTYLGGPIRVNVVVLDALTGRPVPHVDFVAVLSRDVPEAAGAQTVFSSSTLHEYDGVFEFLYRATVPGPYMLSVLAKRGQWSELVKAPFTVLPVGAKPEVAQAMVRIDGFGADALIPALQVQTLSFSLVSALGMPVRHAEVDFQILGPDSQVVAIANKLHTHDNGTMAFDFSLSQAGAYTLRLDPFTLDGEPIVSWSIEGRQGLDMRFEVQPPVYEPPVDPLPVPAAAEATPSIPLALVLCCIVAALVIVRRS